MLQREYEYTWLNYLFIFNMELEAFLLSKWFSHIKEEKEGLICPMICIFSSSVSLRIQWLLWLEEAPDFSLVRNCKLWNQWTTLFPSYEGMSMNYTHHTFHPKERKGQGIIKIMTTSGDTTIRWKKKVIRIPSNKQFLAVPHGVWIHKKYLNQL